MKAAKAQNAGLIGGCLEAEFLQPFRHNSIEPFGITSILKGTDIIIRVADEQCLALAVCLDLAIEPEIDYE
jgi:hypothetical protein